MLFFSCNVSIVDEAKTVEHLGDDVSYEKSGNNKAEYHLQLEMIKTRKFSIDKLYHVNKGAIVDNWRWIKC